ncbi:MAG TPA: DivIVA domain-containing protein [Euzebya sp.]|nr:DivIVA domain-containing protein [Euzebya sp.]
MIVVVLLTIATGAVLLWALYTEQVPPRPSHQGPRWAGLPSPDDIRRRDFPLAVGGYDPRAVDAHLQAVADAYATVRARLAPPPADDDLDHPFRGGRDTPTAGWPTPPPAAPESRPPPPPPGPDSAGPARGATQDRPDGPEGPDGPDGPHRPDGPEGPPGSISDD